MLFFGKNAKIITNFTTKTLTNDIAMMWLVTLQENNKQVFEWMMLGIW